MAEAAAIPIKIYEGQDFYVPAFLVRMKGRDLNEEMYDVVSLTYSDSLDKIDSFEMTINNWDAGAAKFDQTAFKYSDSTLFNPWQDVEILMGYFRNGQDERKRMMFGEITTLTPNFPQSGLPTLSVRGVNLLHRFRTKQQTKPFFAKTDSEIAHLLVNEIAQEVRKKSPRLQLDVDTAGNAEEQPIPYLLMNNQFPIVFLMQRARDIGYELIMEPPTAAGRVKLQYRRTAQVNRKTYVLEWGKSLISFQPSLKVANQASQLTVRGWNPTTKREIKVTVKRNEIPNLMMPAELNVQEPELVQQMEVVVDRPISSEAEARQLATNKMREIGEVLIEARGKTIGLPELRAGVKIQLLGLGQRFSGIYLVTSSTHTIGDGGYTTDFTARMEKL